MEENKYTALLKFIPKFIWYCIGVSIVIFVMAIAISEAFRGESDVTRYLFHQQKNLQIANMELEKEKVKASDDYSIDEKKVITAKIDKLIQLTKDNKDINPETAVKERYGYYKTDLEWNKSPLGKYSQIFVIYTDWHLTKDCPYPEPKVFWERMFTYFYLLCKVSLLECNNPEFQKNIKLMDELNQENIKLYKGGAIK